MLRRVSEKNTSELFDYVFCSKIFLIALVSYLELSTKTWKQAFAAAC